MASRDQGEIRKTRRLDAVLAEAPVRGQGRFKRPGDPWNLLFLGKEENVRRALQEAGWHEISGSLITSMKEGLGDLISLRRLERFPPMNDYTLEGIVQDMNWAISIVPVVRRHHFRLWRLPWADENGRDYWWGSANFDLTLHLMTFSPEPDIDMDKERDFIAETLTKSILVESIERAFCPRIPQRGKNDKGFRFENDGRVLIVRLKP